MYNFENNRQFDAMDILSIMSFFIGLENLSENRVQSAQNDVNAANDKQAKHLLDELGKRLDRQDAMLTEILEMMRRENTAQNILIKDRELHEKIKGQEKID